MIRRPWISRVSQCLIYHPSRDDMSGSHAESSSCPLVPLRIALRSQSEVASGRSQTRVHIQLPSPVNVPHQVGRDMVITTGPFPKCPPEQDGGSAPLNLPCSNGFLPTRLPYVQDHSIARCMSKFSFLKCNFPLNLLASYNAASWLQKRLFCHLSPK